MKKQHVTNEQLIDYVENELSTEQRWNVRQHIKECSQCAAQFEVWQRLLRKESVQPLEERDKQQLWNQIQIETERKKEKKVWFDKRALIAGWCVSCFVFLLLGYVWGSLGHEEPALQQAIQHQPLATQEYRTSDVSSDQLWYSAPRHVGWYSPNQKEFIVYIYDPNVVRAYSVAFQADLSERISPLQTGFWSEGVMQHDRIEPYLINVWQRCGMDRLNCSHD